MPDYQVAIPDDPERPNKDSRSQQYVHLGLRCKIIREILDNHGIGYTDVSPARLFDTTKVSEKLPNHADAVRLPSTINATTVPMLDPDKKVQAWFKQLIIIHTPNSDMQAVINLIRSGEFAKWGLYLNDFDVRAAHSSPQTLDRTPQTSGLSTGQTPTGTPWPCVVRSPKHSPSRRL